ncbi:MAG: hypothetical protein V4657_09485 [Pseudomonadota bacterium]
MGRYNDWEKRLAAYIASVKQDVDALGPVPCARFAAGAVEAQTGFDGHAPFMGKYDSDISAAKALIKYGVRDLEGTFDRSLDRRESPSFAQRGDVVFDGEAVGVCIGKTALFVTDGELTEVPRAAWTVAWATESAHE